MFFFQPLAYSEALQIYTINQYMRRHRLVPAQISLSATQPIGGRTSCDPDHARTLGLCTFSKAGVAHFFAYAVRGAGKL
jgi:hypothetical protein